MKKLAFTGRVKCQFFSVTERTIKQCRRKRQHLIFMKETIDTLQTLILLMTLLLHVITMIGTVYCFSFLVPVLKDLALFRLTLPRVSIQTSETTASCPSPEQDKPPVKTVEEKVTVSTLLPRFKCKCKARLPEIPLSSRVTAEGTLLTYRCGRCGKETEVDPAKEAQAAA